MSRLYATPHNLKYISMWRMLEFKGGAGLIHLPRCMFGIPSTRTAGQCPSKALYPTLLPRLPSCRHPAPTIVSRGAKSLRKGLGIAFWPLSAKSTAHQPTGQMWVMAAIPRKRPHRIERPLSIGGNGPYAQRPESANAAATNSTKPTLGERFVIKLSKEAKVNVKPAALVGHFMLTTLNPVRGSPLLPCPWITSKSYARTAILGKAHGMKPIGERAPRAPDPSRLRCIVCTRHTQEVSAIRGDVGLNRKRSMPTTNSGTGSLGYA